MVLGGLLLPLLKIVLPHLFHPIRLHRPSTRLDPRLRNSIIAIAIIAIVIIVVIVATPLLLLLPLPLPLLLPRGRFCTKQRPR